MASSSSSNDISSDEVDKARKAIEFLSSLQDKLPGPSQANQSSSSSEADQSSSSFTNLESISLQARANTVLSNINRVRSGLQVGKGKGKKRLCAEREEMVKLFPQFKSARDTDKKKPWTHHFVCLAYHDQTSIPTTAWQKSELTSAGLGEQKIVFQDVDCDAVTFKKALLDKFPKLVNGGGYQLCKCKANSRDLMPLSSSVLSTPRALQKCGSA
ncbi:PREDICTED: uncharacterized protein LOC109585966 [Amphimedon queenslandica]|uniref:Uncharacterized protein n=1 Tax=Amphimedon queenslandica TaxID=400682 RepID=A0AAN0JLM7_AMPQE|nr:PREDICTED: uncharacterized protein LOC109585966 [Amphimedon queenslandica]|eukprot:XP_019857669.1 PREDICTED: uncharacterized protein LOC109585966 [Amphimedon queenslandica]